MIWSLFHSTFYSWPPGFDNTVAFPSIKHFQVSRSQWIRLFISNAKRWRLKMKLFWSILAAERLHFSKINLTMTRYLIVNHPERRYFACLNCTSFEIRLLGMVDFTSHDDEYSQFTALSSLAVSVSHSFWWSVRYQSNQCLWFPIDLYLRLFLIRVNGWCARSNLRWPGMRTHRHYDYSR